MKKVNYYNSRQDIIHRIKASGGWVNTHAHLDRAYVLTKDSFQFTGATLQEKWDLVDEVKKNSTVSMIYDRMAYALEKQIAQGVTAIGTFIDVDEVIGDKAMQAATKIKAAFAPNISLKFINQSLKGVLEPVAQKWFHEGAQFVDIIGGLPGKDHGREAEHLDVVLGTAATLNKMVHVHVDQLNRATEIETEILCQKTKMYHLEGRVAAVHGISIAAHDKRYRFKLYDVMKRAQMMLVTCPTAWIDSRRNEDLSPTHNAIAPIEELRENGIPVALGTDNIFDIYKPFTDGDMWTELRFLLESCHYYNIDDLITIATKHGRLALGL